MPAWVEDVAHFEPPKICAHTAPSVALSNGMGLVRMRDLARCVGRSTGVDLSSASSDALPTLDGHVVANEENVVRPLDRAIADAGLPRLGSLKVRLVADPVITRGVGHVGRALVGDEDDVGALADQAITVGQEEKEGLVVVRKALPEPVVLQPIDLVDPSRGEQSIACAQSTALQRASPSQ